MNILKKLVNLVRSSAKELGDAIHEEDDLHTAEASLVSAKEQLEGFQNQLAEQVASSLSSRQKSERILQQQQDLENDIAEALAAGESENQLLERAKQVGDLELQVAQEVERQQMLQGNIDRLKHKVQQLEKQVAELERELDMLNTSATMQKTTRQLVESADQAALTSARESLAKIRARQQRKQDELEAKEQVASDNLEQQLLDAGVVVEPHSADAVLNRIKQRTSNLQNNQGDDNE